MLIALIDPAHVAHEAAHGWFGGVGQADWATCPLTENGVLRILGQPAYPNSPGPPAAVAPILMQLRQHPGHHFWPDSISLLAAPEVDVSQLLTSAQLTDSYLLALAVSRSGRLVTLDRRLSARAVRGGEEALLRI